MQIENHGAVPRTGLAESESSMLYGLKWPRQVKGDKSLGRSQDINGSGEYCGERWMIRGTGYSPDNIRLIVFAGTKAFSWLRACATIMFAASRRKFLSNVGTKTRFPVCHR